MWQIQATASVSVNWFLVTLISHDSCNVCLMLTLLRTGPVQIPRCGCRTLQKYANISQWVSLLKESKLGDSAKCCHKSTWSGFLSCYCELFAVRLWTLFLSVDEILMTPFPILLSAPHDRRARAPEHLRHEINCLRADLRDWSCYNEWLHDGERWCAGRGGSQVENPMVQL